MVNSGVPYARYYFAMQVLIPTIASCDVAVVWMGNRNFKKAMMVEKIQVEDTAGTGIASSSTVSGTFQGLHLGDSFCKMQGDMLTQSPPMKLKYVAKGLVYQFARR